MIRLFVGIELPQPVKEQLHALRGGLIGAKWRPMEKMHLTLRFIGEVEEHSADDIVRELKYIRFPAFHLGLKGIGYFAHGTAPHHLWAGVDSDKALSELQEKVARALEQTGLHIADRFKFTPHVTLARLNGTTMDDVYTFIAQNNLFKTEPFLVDGFALFSSHVRENGEGKFHLVEERFPLSLV